MKVCKMISTKKIETKWNGQMKHLTVSFYSITFGYLHAILVLVVTSDQTRLMLPKEKNNNNSTQILNRSNKLMLTLSFRCVRLFFTFYLFNFSPIFSLLSLNIYRGCETRESTFSHEMFSFIRHNIFSLTKT